MRIIDKRVQVRRRVFLRGAVTAVPAAALLAAGATISPEASWAAEATTLKPGSMATLVRMARDIYPHDRIPDMFYVNAVKPLDAKAAKSADMQALLEEGVVHLDVQASQHFKTPYLGVTEETDRVSLLHGIEHTPFFNRVRSDLVVSFYNQHDLWQRFGYEGSSSEYGGYIHRGFDDVNWLPKV
jgi:hypothetical protein